jgi:hypothetical protein
MPRTGSANYVGDAYGLAWGGTTEKGTATIGVNFGAASVTVNIDLPSRTIPTATGQVGVDTSIYWANGANSPNGPNGPNGYIDVTGEFFGPNASETAGTFSYKTSVFDFVSGQTKELEAVSGSFGAKLCAAKAPGC